MRIKEEKPQEGKPWEYGGALATKNSDNRLASTPHRLPYIPHTKSMH